MHNWQDFEIKCTSFLSQKFGSYATFTHQGGANSTVPDICVTTKTGKQFYIEAKHTPAQCGQFVALPNIKSSSFEYSRLNSNKINIYAKMIMEYMDSDFDAFREAGTAGKDIDMEGGTQIFAEWITHTYKEKNVKYFITNEFMIFPIERILDFFYITAKYRIKRSGSSNVGKKSISFVSDYILKNYDINGSRINGDKLFIQSHQNLHNKRFVLDNHEYMFSQRSDEFEIRRLSNTYNANVIFSISQINKRRGLTDSEFIENLK